MSTPTRVLVVTESPATAVADQLDGRDDIAVTSEPPDAALDDADERPPDCIVVPDDGAGIERLGRLQASAPIVFVAPDGDDDLFRQALDTGATEYVGTDDPALLVRRIQSAVACARAEDARARKSRYERLVENLPVGVFRTTPGPDGEVVDVNETLAEILGADSPEALVGTDPAEPYVDSADRSEFSRKLRENGVVRNEELELSTPDGETVWVSETAIRTEEDGQVYFDGIVEDITERKTYERELAETNARFQALFHESPDMVFVHDDEGVIRDVNNRVCEKLGYDRETLEEMSVWDIDVSIDKTVAHTWETLPEDETPMFDGVYERADGSQFPVEVHLTRLEDGEFLAIVRDVTRRRERERELERQNRRLEAFVDVLSHDIPNHLDVAQTRVDLARRREDFDQLDPVETAHERIDSIVTDMKQLVDHGSEVEETDWVRLSDVAAVCWSGTQCAEESALDVSEDGYLQADESRLKQLFENLFWNACDHAGPEPSVTVGLLDDGFFVADDGPGIPPEKRDDVLSVGFTTSDDDHSGFGLAIVREIARAHGWHIEITDSEAGGARFEFHGIDIQRE